VQGKGAAGRAGASRHAWGGTENAGRGSSSFISSIPSEPNNPIQGLTPWVRVSHGTHTLINRPISDENVTTIPSIGSASSSMQSPRTARVRVP